jgi:hypothetical protein
MGTLPAGMVWGGGRQVGRVREIRPANQGRSQSGIARCRSAGTVEGGLPPLAACEATVDILHGAPVNASATGVSNRRNPLPGGRLRPDSACGRWCVNTQAWVVIQTV